VTSRAGSIKGSTATLILSILRVVGDWEAYLALDIDETEASLMRRHERTERPLGGADFIAGLATLLGRFLRKRRPEPKSRTKSNLSMVSPELGEAPRNRGPVDR